MDNLLSLLLGVVLGMMISITAVSTATDAPQAKACLEAHYKNITLESCEEK